MEIRCFSAWESLREIVKALGAEQELVGVDLVCEIPGAPQIDPVRDPLALLGITPEILSALAPLRPNIVLAEVDSSSLPVYALQVRLEAAWGNPVRIVGYAPQGLEGIFSGFEDIGKAIRRSPEAHALSQRLRAQLMNWADNFYERIRNKRVVVLSSVEPLMVAGYWIADLIGFASALPMYPAAGSFHTPVTWEDVCTFGPDVLVVAPVGASLQTSMAYLPALEAFPGWERVPAVKRGEVVFCDGSSHFYEPGLDIRESAAILFSAIAGFDSGYITPRGIFQRLRWVELRRGQW